MNKISSAKFLTAYAETIKFLKSEKRIQESNRGGKRDGAGRRRRKNSDGSMPELESKMKF
ncbi:hypothetical protein ACP5PY_03525 [Photobacterium leiognathi subsp. mandapamensis]